MLIDLAQHRPDFSTTVFDACIIGGGVAGITLAVKLGQAGRRVLLVEAGDRDVSAKSQAYYRGERGDLENLPLDETRVRALGGSSHHWGGWCRTLDAYDFARSDLSPDGAWPIGKPDLDPYFREAATILGVTETSGADTDLADTDGDLQSIRMYFSKPPANLGANYLEELRQSKNITLMLNAAYLSAAFDADNAIVNSIAVHDQRSPTPLICGARQFVFAMGALENVRHLLILNRKNGNRFGDIGGQSRPLLYATPSSGYGTIRGPERGRYTRVRGTYPSRLYGVDGEISAVQRARCIPPLFDPLDQLFGAHRSLSQRGDWGVVPRRGLGRNCFHHLRAGPERRQPNLTDQHRRRTGAAAH